MSKFWKKNDAAQKKTGESVEDTITFLKPQLEKIASRGQRYHVSEITLAYVAADHMAICKNSSFNTDHLRTAAVQLFPCQNGQGGFGNAFIHVTQNTDEFVRKVGTLLPIAENEVRSGVGDYYVRYNEYGIKETDKMFEMDGLSFDPSKSEFDPDGYLKL